MDGLINFGIELIRSMQTMSPLLDAPMEFISFLGTIEFYLILLPFIYWNINPSLGFRVLMVLIGSDSIAIGFKHLLRQPRPYWIDGSLQLAEETSYGLPSSHASGSLAVWGYLAYQIKRLWLWIIAVALILLIAYSRMYLGVHFPHDILGGWLISIVFLVLVFRYERSIGAWLAGQTLSNQVLSSFLASLIPVIIGLGVHVIIRGSQDPATWPSEHARDLSHFFTLAGATFGAASGFALMRQRVNFDPQGTAGQRLLRYIIGILGVLVIWQGLDILFTPLAPEETALEFILRYLRYGATTFWAMYGAPWVYLRFKLAQPV
jgi:membrane-associated phospholipid phosphatase